VASGPKNAQYRRVYSSSCGVLRLRPGRKSKKMRSACHSGEAVSISGRSVDVDWTMCSAVQPALFLSAAARQASIRRRHLP